MLFEEALAELRKGKKIHRKSNYGTIIELSYDKIFTLNDVIATDWEVLEEPGKTFPEVFEAFKENKKIKRKEWKKDQYLEKGTYFDSDFNCDDLLANDWEIIE